MDPSGLAYFHLFSLYFFFWKSHTNIVGHIWVVPGLCFSMNKWWKAHFTLVGAGKWHKKMKCCLHQKHGSVFSRVNQNYSNVSLWICMWVWELAVISTVEVQKKWIQYPFLICVDTSVCRKILCKGASCCEWFIISDAIVILSSPETISAIIGKLTNLLFSINFIQLRGFP